MLSGGKAEFYLRTLSIFLEDGLERVRQIRECVANQDISLFTTYMHALKSACASIGADELPEMAKALEAAGMKKDLAFVEENAEEFLKLLETLLINIDEAIMPKRESRSEQADVSSDLLLSELRVLKLALQRMDGGIISRTTNALQEMELSESDDLVVRSILKDIMMVDFDDAIRQIDAMLHREQ